MQIDDLTKKAYIERLNIDIDSELNRLGLEKNEANIKKAINIIKQRKDLEIQIKLSEAKIERLKNDTVKKHYKNRQLMTEITSMAVGSIAGVAVGFKMTAATLNPLAIVGGVLLGGVIGAVLGCAGGVYGHKLSIDENEFEKNRQEQITQEQNNLETLKAQLENL